MEKIRLLYFIVTCFFSLSCLAIDFTQILINEGEIESSSIHNDETQGKCSDSVVKNYEPAELQGKGSSEASPSKAIANALSELDKEYQEEIFDRISIFNSNANRCNKQSILLKKNCIYRGTYKRSQQHIIKKFESAAVYKVSTGTSVYFKGLVCEHYEKHSNGKFKGTLELNFSQEYKEHYYSYFDNRTNRYVLKKENEVFDIKVINARKHLVLRPNIARPDNCEIHTVLYLKGRYFAKTNWVDVHKIDNNQCREK